MKRSEFGRSGRKVLGRGLAALAAAFLALSALSPTNANAEERTLRFYNMHTGEHSVVTFKRGGQYVADGLRDANYALRDWRRDQPTEMDPHLLDLLWEVYRQSGSRGEIHIVSAYRAPSTNAMLRETSTAVAENSQHMNGKAMDFFLPDVPLSRLRALGLQVQIGGVGYYPSSGWPFVHLDTGSVRMWPRMTRDQLANVFPEGRSLYIPADGRPLPGYDEALAQYRSQGYVTPTRTQNVAFYRDLFGRGGAVEERPRTMVAAATQPATPRIDPATMPLPPLPPLPQRAGGETGTVMVAAADLPPLPRPIPAGARPALVPIAESAEALVQVASATIPEAYAPGQAGSAVSSPDLDMPIPVMAFAPPDVFDGWPAPFRALSAMTPGPQAPSAQNSEPIEADVGAAAPSSIPVPSVTWAPAGPGGDAGTASVWTEKSSTRQSAFAALAPGDATATFATPPDRVYSVGFSTTAYAELRTDRFSGSSDGPVSTAFIAAAPAPRPVQLASR